MIAQLSYNRYDRIFPPLESCWISQASYLIQCPFIISMVNDIALNLASRRVLFASGFVLYFDFWLAK